MAVTGGLLVWRGATGHCPPSIDGSTIDNAGSVHFTPSASGRGTELRVILRYDPPGGVAGATISRILGEDPETNVREDLHRLKRLIEADELPNV